MNENEFKKLASNSRDWLIYSMLSEKSKEVVKKELTSEHEHKWIYSAEKGRDICECGADKATSESKGETSVEEIVRGIVANLTDKAVLIQVGDRVAWFPKSVITNIDRVVLEPGKIAEIIIKDWFKYKIEWKVNEQ